MNKVISETIKNVKNQKKPANRVRIAIDRMLLKLGLISVKRIEAVTQSLHRIYVAEVQTWIRKGLKVPLNKYSDIEAAEWWVENFRKNLLAYPDTNKLFSSTVVVQEENDDPNIKALEECLNKVYGNLKNNDTSIATVEEEGLYNGNKGNIAISKNKTNLDDIDMNPFKTTGTTNSSNKSTYGLWFGEDDDTNDSDIVTDEDELGVNPFTSNSRKH